MTEPSTKAGLKERFDNLFVRMSRTDKSLNEPAFYALFKSTLRGLRMEEGIGGWEYQKAVKEINSKIDKLLK